MRGDRVRFATRRACVLVLAAALGEPAAQAKSPGVEAAWEALETHLQACATGTGYDRSESGLPEDGLAPGESEWRTCAYDGIEKLIIPATDFPDGYRRIITEDKAFTKLLAAGKTTRARRRERLDILVAEIERAESEQGSAELEGMRDEMRSTRNEMRRMREIQSMMAR